MSSDNLAIRVQDLSKCYEIYDRPQDRLKQSIHPRLQRWVGREPKTYYREFWALKDVSFEVNKGEAVGIIGRNGAGKSTLLQLICGTLNPTSGSVEVEGPVSALLELGSGFNPEFTGRENVILNAQILGLSREETLNRFDDIAGFADIGEFIDQPVKTYSSGMMMRLAFAVQTAVDPKILIVDEALSVGDMFFQAKCMARINKLVNNGVALLFVSHDVSVVRQLCRRTVLLDKGRLAAIGKVQTVADQYVKLQLEERNRAAEKGVASSLLKSKGAEKNLDRVLQEIAESSKRSFESDIAFGQDLFKKRASHDRVGHQHAEIVNVHMLRGGIHSTEFDFDDDVEIRLYVTFHRDSDNLNVSLKIRTLQGMDIVFFDTRLQDEMGRHYSMGETYQFNWKVKVPLLHGNYALACGLAHPPIEAGSDWIFVDIIPHAYEFSMAPRRTGMIDGFVTLPASLNISEVDCTERNIA